MCSFDAIVKVIGMHECPLYKVEDKFKITDNRAIVSCESKPICLTLASDIFEVLVKYEKIEKDHRYVFDCSECAGLIRLEYKKEKKKQIVDNPPAEKDSSDVSAIVSLLSKFPFFQALNEHDIKDLVSFLKLKKFVKGDIIIKKEDPGENLFIIVSGKVEVLGNRGVHLAYLGSGEVFGEMSLLSGNPVGATIKVVESTRVLYLNGEDFRKALNRYPALQMYLACLLAQRLAKTNLIMSEELSSGMIGKLSEIPPSGLFQTFNLNQKSGILSMELPKGSAEVTFREGEIIRAVYNEKEGMDALFELLKEKDGRFKFIPEIPSEETETPKLGDFMGLLMEGVRRIDEESAKK